MDRILKTTNDKVAVIISVYKNDNFINFKSSIDSIIEQDYGFNNINIYLGIDGIVSEEILSYINLNTDLFYKIIKNRINKGLAYTLNRLIETLESENYIFRMDSDDISLASRFRTQINYLKSHRDISIVGTSIIEFSEDEKNFIRKYPKNNYEALETIYKFTIFAHPSVCFTKGIFTSGYRYDETLKYSQDLDLWFRLLKDRVRISNIEEPLLYFRKDNNFYKRRSKDKAFTELVIYLKGIWNLYGISLKYIYPFIRFIIRLLPKSINKYLYKKRK